MDASLHAEILKLLEEHRIMTVATLRPDGWPQATTVGYVNDGLVLYFVCGRDCQKAHNLAQDNRVSLAIAHDTSDPMAIRGLSMAARVIPITGEADIRRILMMMVPSKYPEYAQLVCEVDLNHLSLFKISPEVISVTDYSKGFGHCELTTVNQEDCATA
jgi:nitroimidazol reductase NimA-like FMN-containing flavoprotein (pyridoxamine 5'-phosphate oxidase superfamily)